MKVAAAIFLLSAVPAFAEELPPDLAKAVDAYRQATLHSDIPALASLVTDDFLLVNSNATVESKREFLADFNLPGFHIDGYDVMLPFGKVWGDGAVQGGLLHLSWTQDGRYDTRTLRIAYVWQKQEGHWRATYAQVTRVPG
jgi:ketosteroid isomerase-like protein